MPYQFSKITSSLKKKENEKEKGFSPVQAADVSSGVSSGQEAADGGMNKQSKAEGSDQPSMKQYIVQNKQDYDIEPVGEVYKAAKARDLSEGGRIKSEEEKKYDEMVKSKEKPTWSAPTQSYNDYSFQAWEAPRAVSKTNTSTGVTSYENLEPVAPPTLADVAAPEAVNTAAYDAQRAALENYINTISMYTPNEEELIATPTTQALDLLGNRYGRQDLLRREFEGDTPNYQQGMVALDQALAEREGYDTRPMGQQYVQTKQQSDSLTEGIGNLRGSNVSNRDTMKAGAGREADEVAAQKQSHLNAYQQAQQRFAAYQGEKAKRDAAMAQYNQAQAAKLAQEKQAEEAKSAEDAIAKAEYDKLWQNPQLLQEELKYPDGSPMPVSGAVYESDYHYQVQRKVDADKQQAKQQAETQIKAYADRYSQLNSEYVKAMASPSHLTKAAAAAVIKPAMDEARNKYYNALNQRSQYEQTYFDSMQRDNPIISLPDWVKRGGGQIW